MACAHARASETTALLDGHPRAWISGAVRGAPVESTLNKRDFVYAIEVDPTGTRVAFTHLAPKVYRLALSGGKDLAQDEAPAPIADPEIGSNEFDPEGLAWSPDGSKIAVASRDTQVRVFDAAGKLLGAYATEEPLASVAWSPDGKWLVTGSERGLLTVVDAATLSFQFDLRAHGGSVRGLVFADDGTLWSGGWDKLVRSFRVAPESRTVTEVRMHANRQSGLSAVHGTVDGKAGVMLTVDARADYVTLTPEAALRAGIDAGFLKDHVQQLTPGGTVELPLAKDRTLSFKNLSFPHVDVAICKECVPAGVDGTLGRQFSERYELALDDANQEVILRLKDPKLAPTLELPVLQPGARFVLDGFVNDVTVSRDGTRLGVAMNETKAERNLALYKREKAHEDEPIAAGNLAAIVDAKSGQVVEKHNLHRGIVASAAISPDGRSLASGGWDRIVYVHTGEDAPVATVKYGWCVRRVRFSRDGRLLAVGAWTDQGPSVRNADSDPAAQLLRVEYADPKVVEAH